MKSSHIPLGEARAGLGGLKLDEIDAANSFLMLPMARNGQLRPVKRVQTTEIRVQTTEIRVQTTEIRVQTTEISPKYP